MKRIVDYAMAACCLTLFLPLFLLVIISILLFDGSPIFFRQIRVGVSGTDFIVYKFRTMSMKTGASAGTFDAGDQSRVTGIGLFLRKTKLDELPQIWNVLKGDMAFVGPRPEVRKWVNTYPERWAVVLTVKPGITDPASIYYRNEEELLAKADDPVLYYRDHVLPHKLSLYEDYIRTRSFSGDMHLILKTILSVLFPRRLSMH